MSQAAADAVVRTIARRKLEVASLSEAAYLKVKECIVRCAFMPGARITEMELAELFGMSKTPLREACQRLALEGLMTVMPRQGYQIAPITLRDVQEIFDMRSVLEPVAAERAAWHVRREHVQRLTRLAETRYTPEQLRSIDQFIAANNEIHLTIAQASDNQRLVQTIRQLLVEAERIIRFGMLLNPHSNEAAAEHGKLVKALARRDAAAARLAMQAHIQASQEMMLASLMLSPVLRDVPLQAG